MPAKGPGKSVNKKCLSCKKQNPVATRSCTCGYNFFEDRRRSSSNVSPPPDTGAEAEEQEQAAGALGGANPAPAQVEGMAGAKLAPGAVCDGKRRSERVKREKPNFYDATEYDNRQRKARKERHKEEPPPPVMPTAGRVKRERRIKASSPDEEEEEEPMKRRAKKKKARKEEEEERCVMADLSSYQTHSFAIVLSDINLKLGLNNPKFCF